MREIIRKKEEKIEINSKILYFEKFACLNFIFLTVIEFNLKF